MEKNAAKAQKILPFPQISQIEEDSPATPSLWNERYSQIDANFNALEERNSQTDFSSVKKDGETGSAFIPVGPTEDRGEPAQGKFRFNTDTKKFEGANGEKWSNVGSGGSHMFDIKPWTGRIDRLPEGFYVLNGQEVLELEIPGLQEAIIATGQPYVTAEEWRENKRQNCGKFGLGEGFTILPDWIGASDGSLGKLYFAGGGDALRGTVAEDQNKLHTHAATIYEAGSHTHAFDSNNTILRGKSHFHAFGYHNNNNNGAFLFNPTYNNGGGYLVPETRGALWNGSSGGANSGGTTSCNMITSLDIDAPSSEQSNSSYTITGQVTAGGQHSHSAALSEVGGPENIPKTVYGIWIIQLYGDINIPDLLTLNLQAADIQAYRNKVLEVERDSKETGRKVEEIDSKFNESIKKTELQLEDVSREVEGQKETLQALSIRQRAIGDGQKYKAVAHSRLLGAWYTNESDAAMELKVTIRVDAGNAECRAFVDSFAVDDDFCEDGGYMKVSCIVPAHSEYMVDSDNGYIISWNELK